MGKTVSLKLNSSEEEIINKIISQGISPSKILRCALSNYFNSIDEKVNLFQQEEISLFDKKVNLSNRSEVNQVNQKVNRLKEREVNLEVNQNDLFSENMEKKKVNQKVNLSNQFDSKYFDLYVQQLKNRINQLEKESQELRDKNKAAEQFILSNYQIIQEEYHSLVRDTIKRLDDKFDRIMFYLEGSIKKPEHQVNLNSYSKETLEQNNLPERVNKKSVKETNIFIKKPKKGWVFEMYRM